MSYRTILTGLFYLAMAGCPRTDPTEASPPEETKSLPAVPGSDRDEHGCVPSAGYRWCDRTQQCERPWELGKREGFENTAEAYEAWCRDIEP